MTPNFSFATNSQYTSSFVNGGIFDIETIEVLPSQVTAIVSGKQAEKAFANEAGGHRWQRVPPTEKRGRVHTSTVTVAILPIPEDKHLIIPPGDLDWKTCRGSGAGGQHRNTTDSAVQLTHLPTGLMVRCENERSQHQNKAVALDVLRSRLAELQQGQINAQRSHERRQQVGSGQRGDKVRTVALQRDQVTHHPNNKQMTAKKYLRGCLEELWN